MAQATGNDNFNQDIVIALMPIPQKSILADLCGHRLGSPISANPLGHIIIKAPLSIILFERSIIRVKAFLPDIACPRPEPLQEAISCVRTVGPCPLGGNAANDGG
jgi:hypothetical protein